MFVPPKNKTKNNQQNKKEVLKKIFYKEITQIKQLKNACYLDTKDKDQIK